jgi:hypothetical protein
MKRVIVVYGVLFGLLFGGDVAVAGDGIPPADVPVELFVRVEPSSGEPMPQYQALWSVELNEERVRQPAQVIRLNGPGFPDIDVPLLRWSPRAGYIEMYNKEDPVHPIIIPDPTAGPEDFSWHWYGKTNHVMVSLLVERGVLAGYVWLRDRRFSLRSGVGGLLLGETKSDYWQMHPDEDQEDDAYSLSSPPPADFAMPDLSSGSWDFLCQGSPPSGQHVIDVLVLYTPNVLLEYSNHAGVVARMQLATTSANMALRNSGINSITYSLRGVESLPNSANYDNGSIVNGLSELSGMRPLKDPPYCSSTPNTYVRGRREAMWADVIALARRGNDGTCGYTFIQRGTTQGCIYEPGAEFSDYAYMIFDPECEPDRLNFAHELGHQLGVDHDPKNSSTSVGFDSCPWSFGHRFSDATFGFRSVMAYWEPGKATIAGPTCDNDASCRLIDAFSTPALEWAGSSGIQPVGSVPGAEPIGIGPPPPSGWKQARAVDTLLRVAPITAAFKPRPDSIFSHGFQP